MKPIKYASHCETTVYFSQAITNSYQPFSNQTAFDNKQFQIQSKELQTWTQEQDKGECF